jgi:hypothetical protein
MLPDKDGALALLVAVVRQWVSDARRDPAELVGLADWLGISPLELERRLPQPTAKRRAAGPVAPGCCLWCGQVLRKPARGKFPTFCDGRCRSASARLRKKELNRDTVV